ncbi:hypothetical protein J3B02_002301 [Coemansia erecta]|uniref:Splicing factor Cactin n=1 Tax=Coemansia asiatica TaxID=1052880 RepID=A0A9W7XHP9_9FUNG|nr:hypothetical protein LPJ64_003536 [Coemansia asiatica]KAJ2855176.1 hypothetical protein J3B02_002301 [Coemansia erecta]KAJ2884562.1 hypothetical protein FB639_001937 [Coemansia asiatica]
MPKDEKKEHRSSRNRSRHSSRRRSSSPEHKRHRHRESSRNRDRKSAKSSRSRKSRHESSEDEEEDGLANDDLSVGEYKGADSAIGESVLSKKFVWKKKVEQDRARGLTREEREKAERERREEAERELENLRKRREQREIEKLQREQEMIRKRREQEQEKLGDWERREEEFHLQQAKRRAEIRIRDNRSKPIDIVAMNLRLANEEVDDSELDDIAAVRIASDAAPDAMVEGLSAKQCEELIQDVEMYLSLETNSRNIEFWENLLVVSSAHLKELAKGLDGTNSNEVKQVLREKSLDELLELETDVQLKLSGKGGAVDVDYWEQVRAELEVEKARVTLAAMHQDIVERRAERLRQIHLRTGHSSGLDAGTADSGAFVRNDEVEQRKRERFQELQRRILSGEHRPEARSTAIDSTSRALYEAEMRKEHDPSEAVFSVEAEVASKSYSWQDKYRPRKPRYFNRVHTGYEWNKYNRTHYDKDNPPPKVVQGYKFNIFYPDLIDKSGPPTYRVEKDPQSEDTVILKFMAGPPYEDIAFRIVDREWEYNRRRGFKNTFDRGVLQLHFRFKRHYYRR